MPGPQPAGTRCSVALDPGALAREGSQPAPCPCPSATELLRTRGEHWAKDAGGAQQPRLKATRTVSNQKCKSPSSAHSSVLSEPQTTDHWFLGESEKCRNLAVETQNQWAARARGPPGPQGPVSATSAPGAAHAQGLSEARVVTMSPHTLSAVGPRVPQNLLGSGRDGGGRTSA